MSIGIDSLNESDYVYKHLTDFLSDGDITPGSNADPDGVKIQSRVRFAFSYSILVGEEIDIDTEKKTWPKRNNGYVGDFKTRKSSMFCSGASFLYCLTC